MDKAILKKFAIESRQDLMQKMDNKIKSYYIDEEFTKNQSGDIVLLSNDKHSLSLPKEEYAKRQTLINRIKELGLAQVIEESAYTWFNRIVAIRYMEIHDYLPLTKDNQSLGIRVLSSKDNTPDPEILKFTNLTNPDLDIDFKKEKYAELKTDNDKFKYVLLLVCKKLGKVIPQVFDGVTDYIDILIPDNLLNDTGFVNKIIKEVPEDNFNEVEIIGWLYQYYIAEKKEEIFADLKKNNKIDKTKIPAATQLFTPDWIVKYMIENTVGRFLINKESLIYYIKDTELINDSTNIENIKFIDPCCGSGHIISYAFEVFYKAYIQKGYSKEQIAKNIIKNNIYGVDIDERAVQLSILTICLKAREYDKNIFNSNVINEINIIGISSSNIINKDLVEYYIKDKENKKTFEYILKAFNNADEYGSLIKVENRNYDELVKEIEKENFIFAKEILKLVKQAKILSNKYDIVVTNPPYMGKKNMNNILSTYLQENYPRTKSEMYSAFIERCNDFTKRDGYQAMITIHTWMFISSFEETRKLLLDTGTFMSMIHTGPATFPDLSSFNVLATCFILKKSILKNYCSTFVRLVDYYNVKEKIDNFCNKKNYYYLNQEKLREIPGYPFLYWISDNLRNSFKTNELLGNKYSPKQGLATADNDRFIRFWFEVSIKKINFNAKSSKDAEESHLKWFPYNKGGDYRKWYGNNEFVVNWEFDGTEIKNYKDSNGKVRSRPQNTEYYFRKGITWSLFGFENFGVRYKDYGFIFDVSGSSMFPIDSKIKYVVGYLCSNVAFKFLSLLAPTVNFQVGNIASLPYKEIDDTTKIDELVTQNINICKEEWDSRETSWDFEKHPLLNENYNSNNLKEIFEIYNNYYDKELRKKLRSNEEKLNEIFADIYNVKEDIDCNVNDRDLTIKPIDKIEFIKSFISYAVGCMLGRYSLDGDGLAYAGGEFDSSKYKTFEADKDNIIPITENKYFEDDIVTKFVKFVEVVYGKGTLEENLDFIANTLGKRTAETSRDTIRRYFLNDFYADHLKTYQKRPIYWLFDSGKKNGFKALIYMHRYNDQTVSKIRLDYLHKMQQTYATELKDVEYKLNNNPTLNEKKELTKKQADLNAKIQETNDYDEKIAHIADQRISIDLDDGVAVNYAKFSVKDPKTGKEKSILANSKDIVKKTKNSKEE